MTIWKCTNCGNTVDQPMPPEKCPACGEKCDFVDASCYTPECGGEATGNINRDVGKKDMP